MHQPSGKQLSIKEQAIDAVLSLTNSLVDTLLQNVLTGLREDPRLPEEAKAVVEEKMQEGVQLFRGLETAYLQKKYFRESFKLVVSVCNQGVNSVP